MSYAAQERRRKREAQAERERVLRSIEADKEERRERDKREKERRAAEAAQRQQEEVEEVQEEKKPLSERDRRGNAAQKRSTANIQVRFFDGSTIRHSFPAHQPLSTVRAWIDDEVRATPQGAVPYTLKHLLPPQPARSFEASEEAEPLNALGLQPSATLVLVPVKSYSEAYEGNWKWPGIMGLAYNGVYGAYNLRTGTVGAVTGVIGRVTGYGGQAAAQTPAQDSAARDDRTAAQRRDAGVKIRTLQDQRDEDRREEWYNGNSVS